MEIAWKELKIKNSNLVGYESLLNFYIINLI